MSKEIIVVAEHFTTGGAERVLSELIEEWVKKGCKVTTVQIRPDKYNDSYGLPEEVDNINLFASNNRFIRRFQNAYELIKILRHRNSATVISFVEPAMLVVALTSPFIRNRIIFSERCDPDRNPPKRSMRKVRDIIFNVADVCVFQTEDAKSHFSKKIQSKGVIIPNPVNPHLIEPYRGKRRKAVAFVGRFVPQKNIPLLLASFRDFLNAFPNYKLEMYGRGFEKDEVISLITKYGIEKNVDIKGFCLDVHQKIKDCAMYVSSSDYEGISNSMLEALCIGIPTIVTDCPSGGAREVIKSGYNGILVPVGNKEKLTEAMIKVASNENYAGSLSEHGIQTRGKYPIDKIAQEWISLF